MANIYSIRYSSFQASVKRTLASLGYFFMSAEFMAFHFNRPFSISADSHRKSWPKPPATPER